MTEDRTPKRKEFTRLIERCRHYPHQTVEESEGHRVLAGVGEPLRRLIEDGYLLGLATGNLEAAAHIKLHRIRVNRFFSFGGYGSDCTDRAELTQVARARAARVFGEPVTPDQTIVVGDTPHDVGGVQPAEIQCMGVRSHHFNVKQLQEARADYAIASLQEALPL